MVLHALKAIAGAGAKRQARMQLLAEAGYLWMRVQRLEQSRRVFQGLAALAPDEAAGHLGLAELHLAAGEHQAAAAAARRAAAAPRGNPATMAYANVVLAAARTQLGELAEARRACELALSLDEDGASGRLARAWLEAIERLAAPSAAAPIGAEGT